MLFQPGCPRDYGFLVQIGHAAPQYDELMKQKNRRNLVQFGISSIVKDNRRQFTRAIEPKVHALPTEILSVFSHKQVGNSPNAPEPGATD
jgi:hypothetical protein